MTLQEYFATPETKQPMELIHGALRVADSPTPAHQDAVGALFLALHEHVQSRLLGKVWLSPLDVILDADAPLVVQPDLFFIAEGRFIVGDRVRGAPDLVVEVLSPRPRIGTTEERVGWFAEYGVRECWLVHQIERWIEVLQFEGGGVASRRRFTRYEPVQSLTLPDFDRSFTSMLGYGT